MKTTRDNKTNNSNTNASNNTQTAPRSRLIRAAHTETTVRVYQAYSDAIADAVVENQSFEAAMKMGLWSPTRMTWIKPSKVWMAYRCGWTLLKKDSKQSRVLALDLDRTKFEELLARATLSHTGDLKQQNRKCRNSTVVVQWDPERLMNTTAAPQDVFTKATRSVRSIQIGLRPPANQYLMDPNVVKSITDVTQDFRSALKCLEDGRPEEEAAACLWPQGQTETLLSVTPAIAEHIQLTTINEQPKVKNAVVVLGCTGNPPHLGHLHCLKEATQKSQQLGYNVLFSTIAIAPFGYLEHKMKRQNETWLLNDESRLRVLGSLVASASSTDKEESTFRFLTPTRTYGSALDCGRALRPSRDVTVIVAVGGDRFKWTKRPIADVVALSCARSEEQFQQLQTQLEQDVQAGAVVDPHKWQLMAGSVGSPISSSLVRSILKDDDKSCETKLDELRGFGYPDDAIMILLDCIQE